MKNIKTIAILGLVAMALALLGGIAQTTETVAETVQEFAPIPQATADIALQRAEQEAQVTATYIAELSSQVISDTATTHALQRERDENDHERAEEMAETVAAIERVIAWVWAAVKIAVAVEIVVMSAWLALGVVVALVCYAWERYKGAQAFTPYQVLPDRALYWPEWKMLTDPRTGRQTGLRTEHAAQLEQGQLLIERQIASHKPGMIETMGDTITRAMGAVGRYRVSVRNAERHPETLRVVEVGRE